MKFLTTLLLVLVPVAAMVQVPEDNLIFHLPVVGSAEDNSDSELECTVIGADLTEDRLGNAESAYYFNGTVDYIEVEADPVWDLTFPFSVSIWFQVDEYPEEVATLFKSDEHSSYYSGSWISLTPTGEIAAGYGNGEGIGIAYRVSKRTDLSVSTGDWHHVVAVYNDLNDIDIYVDCSEAEGTYSGSASSMVNVGNPAAIGRYDWRMFKGRIDNIRVYSDLITITEAQYLCQEPPSTSGLTNFDNFNNAVRLYPNPARKFITVEMMNQFNILDGDQIEIHNLIGERILSFPLDKNSLKNEIDLSTLVEGTYLLTIVRSDGTAIYRNKFVFLG